MKGIVMEELKYKLVVLTEKGDFIEIDKLDRNLEVGEEITVKTQKTSIKKGLRCLALAAAVVLAVFIINYLSYVSIFSREYVVVNINPNSSKNATMEIHYNYFGKIIKLQPANKGGNSIIEKTDNFKGQSINIVINKFIKVAEEKKIISHENKNTIVITIADSSKKINDESVDSSVEHYIKDNKINAKAMIVLGNEIDYKKSKQIGIPIDKFILINEAIKKNPSYKFSDLNKKSVDELIKIDNQEGNYE